MEPAELTVDSKALDQFGCCPVHLVGTYNGLYERHSFLDNVLERTAADSRDRFEAFARSVRDILSQRCAITKPSRITPRQTLIREIPRPVSAQVTLLIIDANAFNRLRASEAAAQQAIAMVSEAEANLAAARHRLQQDQATADRAERDRVRHQALVEKHEISRSEYNACQTEAVSAAQAVEADLAAIQSSQQKIAQAQSLVAQREAEVEAARTAYLLRPGMPVEPRVKVH